MASLRGPPRGDASPEGSTATTAPPGPDTDQTRSPAADPSGADPRGPRGPLGAPSGPDRRALLTEERGPAPADGTPPGPATGGGVLSPRGTDPAGETPLRPLTRDSTPAGRRRTAPAGVPSAHGGTLHPPGQDGDRARRGGGEEVVPGVRGGPDGRRAVDEGRGVPGRPEGGRMVRRRPQRLRPRGQEDDLLAAHEAEGGPRGRRGRRQGRGRDRRGGEVGRAAGALDAVRGQLGPGLLPFSEGPGGTPS